VAKKTFFAGIKPKLKIKASMPHIIAVVAFDGVVLGDLAVPTEVFSRVRDSSGRARYEVRICSERRSVGSEHLTILAPWRLDMIRKAHTVIVPGIDNLDREVSAGLIRALRWAVVHNRRVGSICTGAFVLARTGALNGLRATTHWLVANELSRRFPEVVVDQGVLYVDHGNLLTSAGAAAGLDLCLHIVRHDFGADAAIRAAKLAVMPLEREGGQAQFIEHRAPHDHSSMAPVLAWMEQNLSGSLSLPKLANHAGMSTRTLSRRFREQVGTTPARWIAEARVRKVQKLLETTNLGIEQLASESGFGSAAVLREQFRNMVGASPLSYRRSFGSR
jgi:transcriptional regulator GlxA family with amidase domain